MIMVVHFAAVAAATDVAPRAAVRQAAKACKVRATPGGVCGYCFRNAPP